MSNFLKTIVCIVIFSFEANVFAKPVIIGFNPSPPFSFLNSYGKADGLLIKATEKVMKKLEIDHSYTFLPTSFMVDYIEKGEIGLMACGVNETSWAVLGKQVILTMDLGFYHKKTLPMVGTVKSLKGKTVSVTSGDKYHGVLDELKNKGNGINLQKAIVPSKMFTDLKYGKTEYAMIYKRQGAPILERHKMKNYIFSSYKKIKCRWLVSNTVKDAKELVKKLDAITVEIK